MPTLWRTRSGCDRRTPRSCGCCATRPNCAHAPAGSRCTIVTAGCGGPSIGLATRRISRAIRSISTTHDVEAIMHAVILAGGKGIRLRPYTTRIPKPLVPIGDEFSILDIVLRQLTEHGFTTVTLAIGHFGELIRSYVGDGARWGLSIDYSYDGAQLGTMGPVLE